MTFDDGLLEDQDLLRRADPLLRPLAEAGARVRREWAGAADVVAGMQAEGRSRAFIVVGSEARLIRAMLEPVCPVPFVAWPWAGLPGWVGPLDVVLVLGVDSPAAIAALAEAVRRGCQVVLSCPVDSSFTRQFASKASILPTYTGDTLAAAVVALAATHALGLGPLVNAEAVADAMDAVALESSFTQDVASNPAKELAIEFAEATPLVWGGSTLAMRASRRIVEALRRASGRVGLTADAESLQPLLVNLDRRDPFADPFEEGERLRPGLLLLDDGHDDPGTRGERDGLVSAARASDVRVSRISELTGSDFERYVTILQRGRFAAAYLQIGLGRALT